MYICGGGMRYPKIFIEEPVGVLMYVCFFLILAEFIIHVLVVYFVPDQYLVCNFKTVSVYFEGKDCANNTIGFLYFVVRPVLCILISLFSMFCYRHNEDIKICNSNNSTNDFKMLFVFLMLLVMFFSLAYFPDPYTKSARWFAFPKWYWTEFLWDFILLIGMYLSCCFLSLWICLCFLNKR